MTMKYLILIIILLSGCVTNSPIKKTQSKKEQNGALLMGFLLLKMNNKEELSNQFDQVLSIRLKNLESGTSYTVNFSNKNFFMISVEPGIYCLSNIKTYKNFSMNLCKKGKIAVNPGEIKNVGYWVAGIYYDADYVNFKVFDTNTRKIDLFENATRYFVDFYQENVKLNEKITASHPIAGYWYTVRDTVVTYLFETNGSYYSSSEYQEGNLSLGGSWTWDNGRGNAELKNKYGSLKLQQKDDKLLAIFENIKGYGTRWLGFRNPIRTWDLDNEYENPVVAYDRSALDKVSQETNKSIFVKIKYNSSKPYYIARIGKKVFMRPNEQRVVESNVSVEEQNAILDKFSSWRFSREDDNQELTICMINGDYISECSSSNKDIVVFELGKKFPIKGMGFID